MAINKVEKTKLKPQKKQIKNEISFEERFEGGGTNDLLFKVKMRKPKTHEWG